MEKETLKKIFDFIKKNDNRNVPFIWKLLNNEPFTEEELNIKGNLELVNSKITSLPEGLKVGKHLFLAYSKITSLPKGLEVGGNLHLNYTSISSLPNDLKIRGLLDLYSCKDLISLPEGFEVGGRLYLNETNITSLPKGLKVGGNLHITRTPLRKYKDEQLREMIKPGIIEGKIIRYR